MDVIVRLCIGSGFASSGFAYWGRGEIRKTSSAIGCRSARVSCPVASIPLRTIFLSIVFPLSLLFPSFRVFPLVPPFSLFCYIQRRSPPKITLTSKTLYAHNFPSSSPASTIPSPYPQETPDLNPAPATPTGTFRVQPSPPSPAPAAPRVCRTLPSFLSKTLNSPSEVLINMLSSGAVGERRRAFIGCPIRSSVNKPNRRSYVRRWESVEPVMICAELLVGMIRDVIVDVASLSVWMGSRDPALCAVMARRVIRCVNC